MAPREPTLTSFILSELLPDSWASVIHTQILHPHSPVQVAKRNSILFLHHLFNLAWPFVEPWVAYAMSVLNANPNLVALAGFVAFLAVLVLIIGWVHRFVMFWTRIAVSMLLWGFVLAIAAVVYQRGVFLSLRDLVVLGGKVFGFVVGVKEYWAHEYQRYQAQEMARGRGGGS
jgi:hypothetical protein